MNHIATNVSHLCCASQSFRNRLRQFCKKQAVSAQIHATEVTTRDNKKTPTADNRHTVAALRAGLITNNGVIRVSVLDVARS